MNDRLLCDLEWIKLQSQPTNPASSHRDVVISDLFSGCGGLTLGTVEALRAHGFRAKIALALDINSDALAVYRKNFSSILQRAVSQDVTQVLGASIGRAPTPEERDLVQEAARPDIVLAGPPCQGHSDLNNHTRRRDSRNSLYFRVVRYVELASPYIVIIENVPTVVHDSGRVVSRTRNALDKLGYHTAEATLLATHFGVPQTRRRHFLVAVRHNVDVENALNVPQHSHLSAIGPYLKGLEDEHLKKTGIFFQPSRISADNQRRIKYLFDKELFDLPNEQRPPCHRDKEHSYLSMYGRLKEGEPAQTITSGFGSMGQGRFVHPTRPRVITPHEAARLQGFPDFFDFTGINRRTQLSEMIGNAVPPQFSANLISYFINQGALEYMVAVPTGIGERDVGIIDGATGSRQAVA